MNSISNTDLVIIMSDFNAKVGRDRKTWHEAIGKYGYGETNDRGERLLQFFLCNCLMIMNSVFLPGENKKEMDMGVARWHYKEYYLLHNGK